MTTFPTTAVPVREPRVLFRLPGVYRPQADTRLLVAALLEAVVPPRASVLDACTGAGAVALAAARLGVADVTAVDIARRAVLSAWLNTRFSGARVRALRMPVCELVGRKKFDVVLANPPYVPCASAEVPTSGAERAWDAGRDGRAVLEPLCRSIPDLLTDNGFVLLVQSDVAGVERTVAQFQQGGLEARVVARGRNPFGPVMRGRVRYLEREGIIPAGQRYEELVVIRADRG